MWRLNGHNETENKWNKKSEERTLSEYVARPEEVVLKIIERLDQEDADWIGGK